MADIAATDLGFLVNRAARLLKAAIAEATRDADLTAPQFAVLTDLSGRPRSGGTPHDFTAAAISERLDIDPPTVAGILERLEAKGLISREPSPVDRRARVVRLTPSAEELLPRLARVAAAVNERAVAGLSVEEVEAVTDALARVVENLE